MTSRFPKFVYLIWAFGAVGVAGLIGVRLWQNRDTPLAPPPAPRRR